MAFPEIVTREQWLEARKRLLVEEKRATRERDALNAERRRLPMVAIDKEYRLEGADGRVTLAGLFDGRRQLIVQHVMFGPDWEAACPGCTAGIDEISAGVLAHLRTRDTTFLLVSRAPLDKLEKYRAVRGWTIPWYSSYGSDFNYDFQATLDRDRQLLAYNYRDEPDMLGDEASTEVPGFSCFLRDGDRVFHRWFREAAAAGTVLNAARRTALQKKRRALALRMAARGADYLRFASDLRVPFDNNEAEQVIRMSKLRIKVSGCMRSMKGAEAFCAIRSYLATAAFSRHGIGWLDALTSAAAGTPWIPETG